MLHGKCLVVAVRLILFAFVMVTWTVQTSDCKQGGHQNQQKNAQDFNFYYGAACLSYGHSCWGAHGKRNMDVPNNPNAWLSYRMALMRKSANRDASAAADRGQVTQELVEYPPPTYFNVLKAYMQQRNAVKKTNNGYSDDTLDRGTEWKWDFQPNKYVPGGRTYYEEQVLDPRIETN